MIATSCSAFEKDEFVVTNQAFAKTLLVDITDSVYVHLACRARLVLDDAHLTLASGLFTHTNIVLPSGLTGSFATVERTIEVIN